MRKFKVQDAIRLLREAANDDEVPEQDRLAARRALAAAGFNGKTRTFADPACSAAPTRPAASARGAASEDMDTLRRAAFDPSLRDTIAPDIRAKAREIVLRDARERQRHQMAVVMGVEQDSVGPEFDGITLRLGGHR